MLELIERGEAEAAARDFVENIALGPGAWEMMPEADRASMVTNADTFAGEQRDPAWERGDFGSAEWADPEIEFVITGGPVEGRWTG